MKRTKKDLELTLEQLQTLLGDGWHDYQRIFDNCYCGNCRSQYDSTIVDFKIFLNDLSDVILHGKCKTCGHSIARYTETGEDPQFVKAVNKLIKKRKI